MICNFYPQIKGKLAINKKFAAKIISVAVKELKLKKDFEITVLVVNRAKIRNLNRKFRVMDKATDVLSFSQKEGQAVFTPKSEPEYWGDIIICYPVLKKQAQVFGQSLEREFAFLLIHGFLHLLGYNDQTKKEYQQMEKTQNKILTKIYGKD